MDCTIYENNDCEITAEYDRKCPDEMEINVNGENLIRIETEKREAFINKLSALLDEYRI